MLSVSQLPNNNKYTPSFRGKIDYSQIYKEMEKISLKQEEKIVPKVSLRDKITSNISLGKKLEKIFSPIKKKIFKTKFKTTKKIHAQLNSLLDESTSRYCQIPGPDYWYNNACFFVKPEIEKLKSKGTIRAKAESLKYIRSATFVDLNLGYPKIDYFNISNYINLCMRLHSKKYKNFGKIYK